MSNCNGRTTCADSQVPALKSAIWLLDNHYWPVPLNPYGTPLAGHTIKTPKLSQGKEPLQSLGKDWGEKKLLETTLVQIYREHPDAGVGIRLGKEGRLVDADCDGEGAQEILWGLLGRDVPDTYGWLANRGAHFVFLWDDRLLVFTAESGIIKIGKLELRLAGIGRQIQTVFPPTPRADGTPRENIGGKILALPACFYGNLQEALSTTKVAVGPTPQAPPAAAATADLDALTPRQEKRVADFLVKCKEAVSGEHGHDDAFRTAIKLRGRFPITREVAMDMFARYYNPLCTTEEWDDKDIRHKIEDAWKDHIYDPHHKVPFADDDPMEGDASSPIEMITLEDIKSLKGNTTRFLCDRFMIRHHLNILYAQEKAGKTHLALDICRRIYYALEWPNGEPPSFPAGTKTLWVCGDRHQDEILERGEVMSIPPSAFILNAEKGDEYGGLDLDDSRNLKRLDRLCACHHPALIVIDTVGGTTSKKLNLQEEAKSYYMPIIDIALKNKTSVLALTHTNKEGNLLGLRGRGAARALWEFTFPDPNQPHRRRLRITGNFKEPPVLGITFYDDRCEYDLNPPPPANDDKNPCYPGRPRGQREEVKVWILEQLHKKDHQGATRLQQDALEYHGYPKPTYWRAVEELEEDGMITRNGVPQTLHLVNADTQETIAPF